MFVIKEKSIYNALNYLKLQSTYYEGYFWAPIDEEPNMMKVLQDLVREKPNIAGGQIQAVKPPAELTPPTHLKLNDFSAPFQQIVSTYGTPRYREVNPGFFTCMSFPFLFGVMFGDVGHGGFLLFVGNDNAPPLLKIDSHCLVP